MEYTLKPLKKYMVNTVHDSLHNDIFPSYFLQNSQAVFYDEEIYNRHGIIQICFSCLSEDIEQIVLPKNEITSFLRNKTCYDYSQRMYISNDILDLCEKYNFNSIEISYCKICHRIIGLFGISYVFYFNTLEKLHYQQEEIFKEEKNISNGEIIYCPRCHSTNIINKDIYYDERGKVEYDNVCGNCGYFISHFSYGSTEYTPPSLLEAYNKKFQNVMVNSEYQSKIITELF